METRPLSLFEQDVHVGEETEEEAGNIHLFGRDVPLPYLVGILILAIGLIVWFLVPKKSV